MTLFIRLLHPLLVLLFPFAAFRFARRSKNGSFKTDPTDRRTFCFFLPTPPLLSRFHRLSLSSPFARTPPI